MVDLVTEQPPQNLWQITKEKNQNEFVSVPCVPNFVGWVIRYKEKEYLIFAILTK